MNLKPVYAPVLALWMLKSDSVSVYVNTSICFALNVSQRVEMGSAKEIREGKKHGAERETAKGFQVCARGRESGEEGEKGGKGEGG